METIKMKLNSPITDEQWNIITDAELEHSDEIEFTTPSGKKVVYAKVRHGKWDYTRVAFYRKCSECGATVKNPLYVFLDYDIRDLHYCPNCGASMDEVNDEN